MSVVLKTDIVADVLGAANPGAVAAARQRLAERSSAAAESFEVGATRVAPPPRPDGKATPPATRFEAMVLRTFVESLLPDNAESVYGKGLAGDMWKSTMAEKIADQLASRGGIGIANRLLADFTMNGEKPEALRGVVDPVSVVADARSREALRGITLNADLGFIRNHMNDPEQ